MCSNECKCVENEDFAENLGKVAVERVALLGGWLVKLQKININNVYTVALKRVAKRFKCIWF